MINANLRHLFNLTLQLQIIMRLGCLAFFALFFSASILLLLSQRHGNPSSILVPDPYPLTVVRETSPAATARTLLVYSGPTSDHCSRNTKSGLYHRNTIFFLQHGLPCSFDQLTSAVDVVIVLTNVTATMYNLRRLPDSCGSVSVVIREDKCYDMESHRLALQRVNISEYEFFVFLNCGLVGPILPAHTLVSRKYWASYFTDYINAKVKLVGISIFCGAHWFKTRRPHVQSFFWATDRIGLDVILRTGSIYDCRPDGRSLDTNLLVQKYELGISNSILDAGYELAAINSLQVGLRFNATSARNKICLRDIWHKEFKSLKRGYLESGMSPLDTVFWKNSRYSTQNLHEYLQLQEAFLNRASDHNREAMVDLRRNVCEVCREACDIF